MRRQPIRLILATAIALTVAGGIALTGRGLSRLWADDKILLESGGRYEGTIVDEKPGYVKIKTKAGLYTVYRDEIVKIIRGGDVFTEYEKRSNELKPRDIDGWMELADWCVEQELYPQSIDCYTNVIAVEPDHADARAALGYRYDKGDWVTEDEFYERRGYVLREGEWVSPEDKEKLDQGLVQREDGSWGLPRKASPDGREPSSDEPSSGGRATARREKKPDPDPKEDGPAVARRRLNPWGAPGRGMFGPREQKPPTPEERKANLEREKQRGGWAVAHQTKFYDIFSNGPEAEVKKLGQTMDLMCDEYKRIFSYKEDIVHPFPIHLYASQQEFMQKTGRGQGVGGYYDGRKIVGFHGNLGGLSTQSVLFHEGTHQFQGLVLGSNMWRASIWFIEGLAVYFEASEVAGKRLKTDVIPQSRLANVKRAINSGTYIPIRELIRMKQAQFGAIHYAHAWSLIYFLVWGTKGGKERFKQYFDRQKEGDPDPVASFEELFNKPIDEIERYWKDWVKNLSPR